MIDSISLRLLKGQKCNSNDELENSTIENHSNKESKKSSTPENKDNTDFDSCCHQMDKCPVEYPIK
jgi:hypothetical protein